MEKELSVFKIGQTNDAYAKFFTGQSYLNMLSLEQVVVGNVTFEQSRLTFECKKLYTDFIKKENFFDNTIFDKWYTNGSLHQIYIAEIVNIWSKD